MNLHKHLGNEIDFFIMLSSLVGVTGNASQANYAAGNTFQDALARHRTQCGKPAVSLALGAVADVGYVATADRAIGDRTMAFLGGTSINMDHILRLIEDAVRHPLLDSPGAAHVLVGVEIRNWLGSAIRAKVSIFEILQSRSIVEFSELIAERALGGRN